MHPFDRLSLQALPGRTCGSSAIDLILGDDANHDAVIEINARTERPSYIGLRPNERHTNLTERYFVPSSAAPHISSRRNRFAGKSILHRSAIGIERLIRRKRAQIPGRVFRRQWLCCRNGIKMSPRRMGVRWGPEASLGEPLLHGNAAGRISLVQIPPLPSFDGVSRKFHGNGCQRAPQSHDWTLGGHAWKTAAARFRRMSIQTVKMIFIFLHVSPPLSPSIIRCNVQVDSAKIGSPNLSLCEEMQSCLTQLPLHRTIQTFRLHASSSCLVVLAMQWASSSVCLLRRRSQAARDSRSGRMSCSKHLKQIGLRCTTTRAFSKKVSRSRVNMRTPDFRSGFGQVMFVALA